MTSRQALAAKIAELQAAGSNQTEIARKLELSRSYVNAVVCDPDGKAEVERKNRYRKPCPKCGSLMTGSNGNGSNAPSMCAACFRTPRVWTRENIVAAFVAFHRANGRSPAVADARRYSGAMIRMSSARKAEVMQNAIQLPSPGTVRSVCGGWREAVLEAGLTPKKTGGPKLRERAD